MDNKKKTNNTGIRKSLKKKEDKISAYQDLISDDPFEIFFNNYGDTVGEVLTSQREEMIPSKEETGTVKKKKTNLTDLDFMNILKSSKSKIVKNIPLFGICSQIKILTDKEVDPFDIVLYKFPYEMNIKYENSNIFKQLFNIFVNSLKDAYKKYKEEKKEFFIKFNGEFLHFGSDLKTTKGIKKLLKTNEISYKEMGEYLYVSSDEVCLVIDVILNLNLSRSSTMPFLLSTFPFENAMIYTAYLKKERVMKQEDKILSSYILHGPIWLEECKSLLEHNHKIIW